MTRDDVLRLARQAWTETVEGWTAEAWFCDRAESFERFAALVATHVRETEFKPDWNNYQQGVKDGAAAEREACADILDRNADRCDPHSIVYEVLASNAAAIRARSNP